jgi:hypothetical protein
MFALFLRRFESSLVEQAVEAEAAVEAVVRQPQEAEEKAATGECLPQTFLSTAIECLERWDFGSPISLRKNTRLCLVGITLSAQTSNQQNFVRLLAFVGLKFMEKSSRAA